TPTQAAQPPAAAAAPTPRAPAGAGGAVSAQIGAFNTRAQAEAALARQPGAAGKRIEEVQRNGQTLYRAIATGFPNRAAAQSYCSGVSGGCIIR
ncbi:MAG: SPOR domain-containing protein, partial [Proteobacteria bacterium]|nr:SPOR domain-containing protein [Pseudomonadota bacterium]